jgi:hypothetical protein
MAVGAIGALAAFGGIVPVAFGQHAQGIARGVVG